MCAWGHIYFSAAPLQFSGSRGFEGTGFSKNDRSARRIPYSDSNGLRMSLASLSDTTPPPLPITDVTVRSLDRPKTVTRHSSPPKPSITASFNNLLKPFNVFRNQSDTTIAYLGSAEVVQGFRISPKVPPSPEEQGKVNTTAKIGTSHHSLQTLSLESVPENAPIGPSMHDDAPSSIVRKRPAPPFPVRRRNTMDVPSVKRAMEGIPKREEHPKSLLNLASWGSRASIEEKLRVSPGGLGTVLSSVGNSRNHFVVTRQSTVLADGSVHESSLPVICGGLEDAIINGQVYDDYSYTDDAGNQTAMHDGIVEEIVEKRKAKGVKEILASMIGMRLTSAKRKSQQYPIMQ
ncbi:hypothetical protein BC830DRAFT_1090646 [Chytriomyces sp. MP71]|nr:hypothetical protein BC830DRAFT_1090646 [Chytriomyces sp. MP71]